MKLSQLIDGVRVKKMFQTVYGKMVTTHDVEIRNIHYDSRKVKNGDLFVAIVGKNLNGHRFIQDAISNGAKVVVLEDDLIFPDSFFMHNGVVKIVVESSRIALAKISGNYYGNPSQKIFLIGVTGTNGKTTVTHLIKQILENKNQKVGLIGTIFYDTGSEILETTYTTPESLEINFLLSQMLENNCKYCVMEVSSHSIELDRIYSLDFDIGIFTNLSQDHLDFHISIENYFNTKKKFFDSLKSTAIAITNSDDKYGIEILNNTSAKKVFYGIEKKSDYKLENLVMDFSSVSFSISNSNFTTQFLGKFNAYNILASYSALSECKFNLNANDIEKLKPVLGRFHSFKLPNDAIVIVDYAHTPDALENVLKTIQQIILNNGKIITVFGCGGNRDKSKRKLMGKIAENFSYKIIFTSDNPRNENVEEIIEDIKSEIIHIDKLQIEVDRKKAIYLALSLANKNDIVLIAGKGHENYQIIGEKKIPFSDISEVENFILSKR